MLRVTASQEDLDHGHEAPQGLTRRHMVSAALAGLAMTGPAEASEGLRWTSADFLGPFYPLDIPNVANGDLTRLPGRSEAAKGRLLYVSGRVLNPRGEPIPQAQIEIWQANAAGRYAHPGDTSKAPLDPNFRGFARLQSGADGSYQFKTILPGLYEGRTRHIHFDLRGKQSRLVTQMYFEGEPRNETDPLLKLQAPVDRKTLIARPGSPSGSQERDAMVLTWDIVLAFG
ncbi:intradiol ring-cleavage dioxygenase [Pelomonas sp. SE-A7]|uniref:dioxygenase family protein n=1 Tax=Pelomonas sp. SE-A7 TaxID=3054953 RepID=UPI00259CA5E3|nr:intradiol ring-cleavage dioxygenase [Pelomonas sp. SE-A7]MDM4765481.1 intradiol ring-cleavage dioxygenase [Pelomonas sp. SE-A7]